MTRRKWTDATIEADLTALVGELGRMPTRKELTDRRASGLWSAMHRHGGIAAWRSRVTPPVPGPTAGGTPASPATPTREDIARRAYFLGLEQGGGDPFGHWL